ncbi:hypothetical protein ACFQV2_06880 [Actinokineospora soli]|uniref:Uncharacterized protein n=1 Tax=Actinokineospora soli TaxID=1048753 RepID=A0ABW2TLC9_9PSEU
MFGDLGSIRDSKNAGGPVLHCDVSALVQALKDDRRLDQ